MLNYTNHFYIPQFQLERLIIPTIKAYELSIRFQMLTPLCAIIDFMWHKISIKEYIIVVHYPHFESHHYKNAKHATLMWFFRDLCGWKAI